MAIKSLVFPLNLGGNCAVRFIFCTRLSAYWKMETCLYEYAINCIRRKCLLGGSCAIILFINACYLGWYLFCVVAVIDSLFGLCWINPIVLAQYFVWASFSAVYSVQVVSSLLLTLGTLFATFRASFLIPGIRLSSLHSRISSLFFFRLLVFESQFLLLYEGNKNIIIIGKEIHR